MKAPVAANRLPRTTRDTLRFRKRAQKIFTKYLPDISFTVTPLEQLVRDVRQHRNVFRAFRHVVRAVEVSTDADMIDARDLDDVFEMIDQLGDRKRRQGIPTRTGGVRRAGRPARWTASRSP